MPNINIKITEHGYDSADSAALPIRPRRKRVVCRPKNTANDYSIVRY